MVKRQRGRYTPGKIVLHPLALRALRALRDRASSAVNHLANACGGQSTKFGYTPLCARGYISSCRVMTRIPRSLNPGGTAFSGAAADRRVLRICVVKVIYTHNDEASVHARIESSVNVISTRFL